VAAAIAVCASLAGCIDVPPERAWLRNETADPAVVRIVGTDYVVELAARSSRTIDADDCVGTQIVFEQPAGTVVATYDGPVCPTTDAVLKADATTLVRDGKTEREPAAP